jgi:rubrerythrin
MAEIALDVESVAEPARLAAPLSRFRCQGCGYGASCRIAPERCPMCGRCSWSSKKRPLFADDVDAPLGRESSY